MQMQNELQIQALRLNRVPETKYRSLRNIVVYKIS